MNVPNVVGLTTAQASAAIRVSASTVGATTNQPSATIPAGRVISSNPVARGERDRRCSAVNLEVSSATGAGVPGLVMALAFDEDDRDDRDRLVGQPALMA